MYNKPSIQQPLYPMTPQNDTYQSPIYPNNTPYQNIPSQNYVPIPTQPPIINQPMSQCQYLQKPIDDQTINSKSFSELYDDLSEVR